MPQLFIQFLIQSAQNRAITSKQSGEKKAGVVTAFARKYCNEYPSQHLGSKAIVQLHPGGLSRVLDVYHKLAYIFRMMAAQIKQPNIKPCRLKKQCRYGYAAPSGVTAHRYYHYQPNIQVTKMPSELCVSDGISCFKFYICATVLCVRLRRLGRLIVPTRAEFIFMCRKTEHVNGHIKLQRGRLLAC